MNKHLKLLALGFCTAILAIHSSANAAVTFIYEGTVTNLSGTEVNSAFSIGNAFSFTYTFEETTLGSGANPTSYTGAITNASVSIGPTYVTTGTSGNISVKDDGADDDYLAAAPVPTGATIGAGFNPANMNMSLFGGSVFSDESLPSTQPDPANFFGGKQLSLSFSDGSTFQFVQSTDFTVSAVPLPAALPLFAGALGLFGLLGWRRKRAAAA